MDGNPPPLSTKALTSHRLGLFSLKQPWRVAVRATSWHATALRRGSSNWDVTVFFILFFSFFLKTTSGCPLLRKPNGPSSRYKYFPFFQSAVLTLPFWCDYYFIPAYCHRPSGFYLYPLASRGKKEQDLKVLLFQTTTDRQSDVFRLKAKVKSRVWSLVYHSFSRSNPFL